MKSIRGGISTGNPEKSTAWPVAAGKGLCLHAALHINAIKNYDNGLKTMYYKLAESEQKDLGELIMTCLASGEMPRIVFIPPTNFR